MTTATTTFSHGPLPRFAHSQTLPELHRSQHALARTLCAALNHHFDGGSSPAVTLQIQFTVADEETLDKDLVRRAFDTSAAALHPPVDPQLLSVSFLPASDVLSGTASVVLLQISDASTVLAQAPQFSVCGKMFAFSDGDDAGDESKRSVVQLEWENPAAQVAAQQTALRRRLRAKYGQTAVSEAAEVLRSLYPAKGNDDVLLEPVGGFTTAAAAVVGFCNRHFYIALPSAGEKFQVIAKAPHGGDVGSCFPDVMSSSSSSSTSAAAAFAKSSPSWITFQQANSETIKSKSVQWLRTSQQLPRVQLVAYRVVRERSGAMQLEDCFVTTTVASSSTNHGDADDELVSVFELNSALSDCYNAQAKKVVALRQEGASTARGAALKHMTDPSFIFAVPHKKQLSAARTAMDKLFSDVTGLPQGGGAVRSLSAFTAADASASSPSSSSADDDDDDDDGATAAAASSRHGRKRVKLQVPEETQLVEFKQQLHRWQGGGNSGNIPKTQSHANTERARRILAAFANTRGGLLFVGVSDSGELVGIPDSVPASEALPRVSGFIPGMPAQTVSTIKIQLREPRGNITAAALQSLMTPAGPGAVDIAARGGGLMMSQEQHRLSGTPNNVGAAQWWKTAAPGAAAPAGTADRTPIAQKRKNLSLGGAFTGVTPPPAANNNNKSHAGSEETTEPVSVHVLQVMRGPAPFYCTPGMAAPPVRGQASTLSLSTVNMLERVAAHIAAAPQKMNSNDQGIRRKRE